MPDAPLTAVGAYVYAGGFSVGVRQAGFDVLCHLEGDNGYGVADAKLNWPDLPIQFGPANWPLDELRERAIDFGYANPPCALFSSMGIVTTRGDGAWRTDSRLDHWWDSFRVLERVRPRAWCLESVTNAYTKGREVIDEMTKRALMGGYSVTHLLLDAKWTGLPQSRRRFFIVVHRQPRLVGYHHNWAPPPTIGEALATVSDPGAHNAYPPQHADAVRATRPGEKVSTAWMRINPGYETRLNAQGNVAGRPSFQTNRIDPTKLIGAFIGDKYVHWAEDRLLGFNEMKAICGYPEDFKLAGPSVGWPSMLARAVMPPVGRWLAAAVAETLRFPEGAWSDRRVTLVDVREPDREPVDLTGSYLDAAGRVRLRARTDGTVGFYAAPKALQAASARVAELPRAIVAPAPVARLEPPRAVVRIGLAADSVSAAVPLALTEQPARENPPAPSPASAFDPANPAYAPRPGEGSGALIKRLWRETELTPEQLVAVVHANWTGRTTKTGDVYYNYRKLLDAGETVRPWPKRAASIISPSRKEVMPNGRSEPRSRAHNAAPPVTGAFSPRSDRPLFLVTGCTPIQIGSERTALQIITSTRAMVAALDALGFEVDWRAVTPGEDLERYAGCLVYLQKSNSIASRYFYGALWTMLKRPDSILGMDDWQTHTVHAGFKTFARSYERAFRLFDRTGEAEFEKRKDELFAGIQRYAATERWPHPVIVPVFEGGDVRKLRVTADEVVPIDPTAFAPRYPCEETERKRAWVQASLLVKPPPSGVRWPVTFFGNAGSGYGGVGKSLVRDPQPRVPEPELMRVYCAHRGVLSPAHDHPGSGWWRVRYLMAADAGCVLSAHPGEACVLGEPYAVASDPRRVEAMSDEELDGLADAQALCLAKKALPREVVLERLAETLSIQGVRIPTVKQAAE